MAWGGLGLRPRGWGGLGQPGAAWGVPLGVAEAPGVAQPVAGCGVWDGVPQKNGLQEDCKAGVYRLEVTGWTLQAGMLDVSHARASGSTVDFGGS